MIIPPKIARIPVIWELRKLTLYGLSLIKTTLKYRTVSVFCEGVIFFPRWWKYQQKNNNPLKNDIPWITFKAENFLSKTLRQDMKIFEYGSGSSTLYFSRRVARVYSVEHNPEWHQKILDTLDSHAIKNVECRLTEPEIMNENQALDYVSRSSLYADKNFASYVKSINEYPDGFFDIVIVDGRSRTRCISHAKIKIKKGGYLVVDNSDREYYFEGNDYLYNENEWKSCHFIGPIPYSFEFSKTSVFQKK